MLFLITASSFLSAQPEGEEGDSRGKCNEKPDFLDSEAGISRKRSKHPAQKK